MATKIRPIVFKINEPEGFVMNASNATYTESGDNIYVSWQGPAYPDGYNGNGKQYILVNNNATAQAANNPLMYGNQAAGGGPDAIGYADMKTLGTSTGVLLNNPAPGYGTYLVYPLTGYTLEQAQAYMANVTITIMDP